MNKKIVSRLINKIRFFNYTIKHRKSLKVSQKMANAYTEHEQKIALASKAWRFYEWICSDDFAQHEEDRHVVIAEGSYTGRPSIPLEKKKKRALNKIGRAHV